jgi:hypothetical protein
MDSYYNSLDLDYQIPFDSIKLSCTKKLANSIALKIAKCKYSIEIQEPKHSNYKGFHIEFYCTKKCDLCRLVFDDIQRFEMDKNRPIQCTNLIWDSKHGY